MALEYVDFDCGRIYFIRGGHPDQLARAGDARTGCRTDAARRARIGGRDASRWAFRVEDRSMAGDLRRPNDPPIGPDSE